MTTITFTAAGNHTYQGQHGFTIAKRAGGLWTLSHQGFKVMNYTSLAAAKAGAGETWDRWMAAEQAALDEEASWA